MKLGCAYDEDTDLGPVVNAGHKEKICNWIQKGIDEGAELVLDGRNVVVPGYENCDVTILGSPDMRTDSS